ncbi:MAG: prolyl oligopeptidase family serine peptidase [Planctomycetes bacterium]|nr:prolyl oligopeptidase family serine peptidase [Planctomycetota bacterium]
MPYRALHLSLERPAPRALPILLAAFALASFASASGLPGFTLVGEDWTYDPGDGGTLITGKLIQPTLGAAPHPAVLISHGQGGSAGGFSAQKAAVMRTWGLVCIAPNYTHVDGTYAPGTDGWSAENERRARACLTILASRSDVDPARIAAYGNSKGAFVTAGLAGATPSAGLRAAAITAGGTSGTSDATLAAPTLQEVQGITAPFLLLHGTADTTVPPSESATLASVLDAHSTPNARHLWNGVGHDLHAVRADDVYALERAWFSAYGVLGDPGTSAPTVTAIGDLLLPVNTASAPLPFAIGDATSTPAQLLVSAFSLDPALVAPAGLVLQGAGASRTLVVTPVAGAAGTTTIVVLVDDGGLSTAERFEVQVGSVAQSAFCAGDGVDPNVTTPCPCANSGGLGRGCAHSANPAGALLATTGTPNPDTLVLAASGMPATAACIFLQGDAPTDVVFGDGVRCAGGTLLRLATRTSAAGASSYPGPGAPSVSTRGQVTPGSGVVRSYQTYFRNAAAAFCPPATFNVTNGARVTW